jgi:predicted kinase
MNQILTWCPTPPGFKFDWLSLDAEFDWIRALEPCPQDAIFHAEGNVWIHTRMVCEALLADERWRALAETERRTTFLAALMHDIAKPACTRAENGRLTSRGHSKRGEIMARQILWRHDVPFAQRESIVNLIRFHQVPLFLHERSDSQRTLFELSQTTRCDWLALVAEADARGRICADQQRLLDNIARFAQYAQAQGCWQQPRRFASAHSRFLYFQQPHREPDETAPDDTVCEVLVMSGIPGVGKNHWIATQGPDWPVVSLDDLRRELNVKPTEDQTVIVQRARALAREHLRRQQSFIWNATSLSREHRAQLISLCAAQRARIRIVYIEVPAVRQAAQNIARESRVPEAAIQRMLEHWEVPDLTEAHQVDYVIA